MKLRSIARLACLAACLLSAPMARAEDEPPIIRKTAIEALQAMGKSLSAPAFSFQDRTIREYTDANGQPLHIFHTATILVRRPDRLSVALKGDDGATRIAYDGKSLTVYSEGAKKYATIPVPDNLEGMLKEAITRLGVDFPLADFLADAPDKAFLSGVTSGYEVNVVPIDGVPCSHFFFTQPPGIELELWLEKNARALPRRLIVTYRSLPGEPRFIAEMWDWDLSPHPDDSAFVFHVPEGATKVEFKQEAPK
jgi:hypothetical protein